MEKKGCQKRKRAFVQKIDRLVKRIEFAGCLAKIQDVRSEKPREKMVSELRFALLEQYEKTNSQIHEAYERHVEPRAEILGSVFYLEIEIIQRLVKMIDILQRIVPVFDSIPGLVAHSNLVKVAVNILGPLDLFVLTVEENVAKVVALFGEKRKRRVRLYFFGLDTIASVNPSHPIVRNRLNAQAIPEIKYPYYYEQNDHGKCGDQLSLACQVSHLPASLK
jgi:hypothetical protein